MINAGYKNLIEPFGWFSHVKTVAETGFFTFGGHSAFKSVMLTPLYEVMSYLEEEAARSMLNENIQRIQAKK